MYDRPRSFEDAVATLAQIARAIKAPAALAAAVELGTFRATARRAQTAESIARQTRCSVRGTRILCDTLVALNVLSKQGRRYRLLPIWRPLLDPESRLYAGGRFAHFRRSLPGWADLARAVRTGRAPHNIWSGKGAKDHFSTLVPALFAMNLPDARFAMKLLGVARVRSDYRVLDLAAGSSVWGIAAARANRRVEVTAADFPEILPIARRFARREGTLRQYRFLGGDVLKLRYGEGRYDLVLLGYICHHFSPDENLALFRKLYRALRPGGRMLIVEFAPYDDRSGPPPHVLFGLDMLLATHKGDAFSRGEYLSWLDAAGFRDFRVEDRPGGTCLIVASRSGPS